MKKPFVLIAAIVAVVGLGAAVAVAKETIKVKPSVTLKFTGKVREGSDRTNDRGKYKIKLPGSDGPVFIVKAKEKRITKSDGDKVVCKAGKSKRLGLL